MVKFPKVLVACPTAAAKNYTAEEWIRNTQKFHYPNYDVVVFDNTPDNGENTLHLQNLATDIGALNFEARFTSPGEDESLIERMCFAHQECANYAILNGYDYLLHLESDVIPEPDVIDRLIQHNLPVVGGLYYRDSGKSRRLMVQRYIMRSPKIVITENFLPEDDVCFIDGSLKKVASIGLGCVLIKTEVLKKIPFRFVEGEENHPDTYFSEDCFRNGIKIFADTEVICKHNNEVWGIHGFNWK